MLQTPMLYRWILGRKLLWRMNPSEKAIYLTFDDGPCAEVTPTLLDILDQFQVKATFFCLGKNIQAHPEIFSEIMARGHAVGNHGFDHLNGFKTATLDYIQNADTAKPLIPGKLYRPPYGRITPAQVRALQKEYQIVMWDTLSYDFDKTFSPEKIVELIKRRSRNGSIVVFHDSLKAKNNLLATLPEAIKFWQSEAYELKTLD